MSEAVDNKAKDVENTENKENKNINKVKLNENLAKVKAFTADDAGYNQEFKQRANQAYNKYSYLLNADADESIILNANDALYTIIQDASNNLASIEDTEEKVFDEEKIVEDDKKEENLGKEESGQVEDSTVDENNKVIDENNSSNENTTEQNQENNKVNDNENKEDNKAKLPYNNNKEFVDFVGSFSEKAKAKNIFPSVMIGQAAHESGFGRSDLTVKDKSLFGIKAQNNKPSNSYKTEEYIDGELVKTKADFRAYDSFEESIDHYLNLLNNGIYAKNKVAEAKTAKEQLERIKKSGYATDPNYVSRVLNLIKSYNLTSFDEGFKDNLTVEDNKNDESEKPSTKPSIEENLDKNEEKVKDEKKFEEKNENVKDQDKKEDSSSKTDVNKSETSKPEVKKESEDTNKKDQADDQVSEKELKQNLIDKINKVKILLKDGTWTKESGKKAENIILKAENALIKDEFTKETYKEIANELDSIQINVLKKETKSNNAYKPSFDQEVVDDKDKTKDNKDNKNVEAKKLVLKSAPKKESESTNVKTGVKSLSSVLLTLSSAGAAFFASRKRK